MEAIHDWVWILSGIAQYQVCKMNRNKTNSNKSLLHSLELKCVFNDGLLDTKPNLYKMADWKK